MTDRQPGSAVASTADRRGVACIAVFALCFLAAVCTFLPWVSATFSDAPDERPSGWELVDNPHDHLVYVDGGPFVGTAVKHWVDGGALPVVGPAWVIGLAAVSAGLTALGWRRSEAPSGDTMRRAAHHWTFAAAAGLAIALSVRWNHQVWTGAWGDFGLGVGLIATLIAGLAIGVIAAVLAVRARRAPPPDTTPSAPGHPTPPAVSSRAGLLACAAGIAAIAGSVGLAARSAAWSSETTALDALALFASTSGLGLALASEVMALSVRLRRGTVRPVVRGVWAAVVVTLLALLTFSLAPAVS